jgi:hypothetical protein
MLSFPHYGRALRCIGQALQAHGIEAFELKTYSNEFRLLAGDPNPPYTALIELKFSPQKIEVLDREGQARRGESSPDVRFDSVPEMLRAIGEYVDVKQGQLRRIDNSCSSSSSDSIVTIEYQMRTGDVQTENLTASFIREACVHMYKRRARLSNPINLLTRKR